MTDTTFTRQDHETECTDRRQSMREFVCLKLKPIKLQLGIYWVILVLFISGLLGGSVWKNNVDAAQNERIKNNEKGIVKTEEAFIRHHQELIARLNRLEDANNKKFNAILRAVDPERDNH